MVSPERVGRSESGLIYATVDERRDYREVRHLLPANRAMIRLGEFYLTAPRLWPEPDRTTTRTTEVEPERLLASPFQ